MESKKYSYRLVILLVGFLSFGHVLGQQSRIENLITFDDKPYHFGYFFGASQMLFAVKTNAGFEDILSGTPPSPSSMSCRIDQPAQ